MARLGESEDLPIQVKTIERFREEKHNESGKPHSFFSLWRYAMISLLLAIMPAQAAVRDSLPIDTAKVVVSRKDFAFYSGFGKQINLSANWSGTLAGVLAENGIYIKQYGYTGLATVSMRGADPQQTQVLWNGIPVSNPMAGMADLNTFGIAGVDEILLLGSGGSSFYGSGNVGGSLLLFHHKPANEGISAVVNSSFSSYGNFHEAVDLGFKKKRFYLRNTTSYGFGNNNFPYSEIAKGNVIKMKAAGSTMLTERILGGFSGKRWEVKSVLEYSDNYREFGTIPFSEKTVGLQYDRSYRAMGEVKCKVMHAFLQGRLAYFNDFLRFADSNSAMDDTSRSNTLVGQMELYYSRKNWNFLGGVDVQRIDANTESYLSGKTRIYPANFIAVNYVFKGWNFNGNARFEWYEKVPVYAVTTRKKILRWLEIFGNYHRSFRRPALNDLFWEREENHLLIPEQGWGAELGGNINLKGKWQATGIQFTFYKRGLKHPIIWMPNGSVWEAMNMAEGKYTGFQMQWNHQVRWKKNALILQANWDHVYAQMRLNASDVFTNRIFIPADNGNGSASYVRNKFRITWNTRYTGSRFITTDNSDFLPHYLLTDCFASYAIAANKIKLRFEITGGVENLFNTWYQVMPARAMPLRGYKLTIRIK